MKRFQINIVGESGSGLMSVGEIVIAAFHRMGFYVFADREFPSLIKGGYSCFSIVVSDEPVSSYDFECEVMVALDKQGLEQFSDRICRGGILVHGYERLIGVANICKDLMKDRDVRIVHLDARKLAKKAGGTILMSNVVVLGALWKVLGLDYGAVLKAVEIAFASKPKLLEIDKIAMKLGYDEVKNEPDYVDWINSITHSPVVDDLHSVIDGNQAIAMGAVLAGCRAYFAYPMSPSSSILSYLSLWAPKTGMMVKQAEDEITAAQLNIGASYAGTRALTATSGGGFDLMTESLSLAAMIEVPFVLVDVQRPGPATGLPTWTAQGDVDLMKYSGHGEYTRLVVSVSSAQDAVILMQEAFDYAEKYQIPVLVLSEKFIADAKQTIKNEQVKQLPINRYLYEDEDVISEMRYAYTESGVSSRWIPGSNDVPYFANGDEHYVDGSLTEDARESQEMIAKRIRKEVALRRDLREPKLYGSSNAKLIVIGFGSVKLVMDDVVKKFEGRVAYLNFSYLWPLKIDYLLDLVEFGCEFVLVEGNATGQFGKSLENEISKFLFKDKFLKYDGRPFYFEEVCSFVESNLNENA